jgi:succinate dehydrogenase/fumarate reductase flavoprotein subunit
MKHPAGTIPKNVDLVVLGGGLAGHAAALEAAAKGAKVLLLEKRGQYGGSTVQSSGSFAFAGTKAQRDAGFEDSPKNMANDIMKASLTPSSYPSTSRTRQMPMIGWLNMVSSFTLSL